MDLLITFIVIGLCIIIGSIVLAIRYGGREGDNKDVWKPSDDIGKPPQA